jgi:hypothetical protein
MNLRSRCAEQKCSPRQIRWDFTIDPLLGPRLQQGWAVEAADGRLLWAEGGVEEMARCTDSTVQQQQQEEVQREYIEIPRTLDIGY